MGREITVRNGSRRSVSDAQERVPPHAVATSCDPPAGRDKRGCSRMRHAGTHTFYGVTLHLHNPSSVRNHFVIVRYQTEAVAARLGDEHPIKWIVVNVRQIRYIDTMSRPHG